MSSTDSNQSFPFSDSNNSSNISLTNNSGQPVVLLLPLQGNLASAGQAVKAGFLAANQNNNIPVQTIDTSQYPSINAAYAVAQQKNPSFIVGPLSKSDVQQLQQQNLSVPTLALNYADETSQLPSNLYEFGLSPLDEARQTADRAAQDNHRAALVIYPNSNWGKSVANALEAEWQQQNGTIVDSTALSSNDSDLNNEISTLLQADPKHQAHRQDMDVIFLIASPSQARVIKPLFKYYFAGDVPVYSTSMIYAGGSQPALNNDLNGIKFCDMPWLIDNSSSIAQQRNQVAQSYNATQLRLYAFGMDAYLLTQELNKLGSSPSQGISGATGQLYVNQQRIHRQLQWAQFQNGQATEIS
jgi:outer membrane PBP1 activator LpoA protein